MSKTPQDLINSSSWIRWIKRKSDGAKLPASARNGLIISVNDFSEWSSYEEASRSPYGALGFVFTGNGIVGIDLDDCIEHGAFSAFAEEILDLTKSYAEISPSGSGVHIYIRSHNAPTVKKTGLEIYSNHRFFTFTEDRINDCDVTEFEDWNTLLSIYDKYFEKEKTQETEKIFSVGSRNNSLFSYAALMRGKGLQKDEISKLVFAKYENDIHDKTGFPTSEVEQIIKSAMRYSAEEAAVVADAEIELTVTRQTEANIQVPKSLIEQAPGLVGDLLRDVYHSAVLPNAAATLAATLAALGTLCGRTHAGSENDMRTNLYALALAPKGSGKDHPKKMLKAAFTRAGLFRHFSVSDITSDAAIYNLMRSSSPSCLLLDEIGVILRNAYKSTGPAATIAKAFLTLYNEANERIDPKAYAGGESEPLEDAHLCIYGAATHEQMQDALCESVNTDGLFARMMIFSSSVPEEINHSPRKFDANLWGSTFKDIFNSVDHDLKLSLTRTLLPTSHPIIKDFSASVASQDTHRRVLVRMHEHVRKIYLICCALGVQRDDAARWAVDVAQHLIEQAKFWDERATPEGQYDRFRNQIISIIENNGGQIARSLLTLKAGGIPRKTREDLIKDLLESGAIIEHKRIFVLVSKNNLNQLRNS